MAERKRIDVLLVEQGMARSREEAKEWIRSGGVCANGTVVRKASQPVSDDAVLTVQAERPPFVSRGGLKLAKALAVFPIRLTGCTALDIGASTGGFTDCMLQAGAHRVYAVDVGSGQLATSLRQDERVVNLEKTNIRALTSTQIPVPVDFFCTDVSVISLSLVLPEAARFVKSGGEGVCLIKPQFEVGRGRVGKNGIVRDPLLHEQSIRAVRDYALRAGFSVQGLEYSPIQGGSGNIEYLMYLRKTEVPADSSQTNVRELVRCAHRAFREEKRLPEQA